MTDQPDTQYTRSADGTALAYQVSGRGPVDLLFLQSQAIPLDLLFDDPGWTRIRRRLDGFCRSVWLEPRGLGASEGTPVGTFDNDVMNADLTAVLDAVGCDRVFVVGATYSGTTAIQFAVTHAYRVRGLVLIGTFAHYLRSDDYPIGIPRESKDVFKATVQRNAETGAHVDFVAPSRAHDQRFRIWWSRGHRLSSSPKLLAEGTWTSYERDVRQILDAVSMPTLVIHRADDKAIRVEAGRYLGEHIPGAKYVELPGEDNLPFVGDTDAIVDEIEEFLTGFRGGSARESRLQAILFTDIVKSTERQARGGHREWSRLTDEHDVMVRHALARTLGHEVKTTGDGFLATFDSAGRALRCAHEVVQGALAIGLEVRAGVHAGDVEIRDDDIGGLAVAVCKRICDLAGPTEILASAAVQSLVIGSTARFNDGGDHQLKGVPGMWRLFALDAV